MYSTMRLFYKVQVTYHRAEFNKFKTDVTACAKRAILLKDVNLDRKATSRLTALMGNASAGLRVPDRNSQFLINIEPPRTPRQ